MRLQYQLVSGGSVSYTGDGSSGAYVWGAQLEAAAFPSSYIPTTTASVTRAADVATVAVSGLAYPLTLFAEVEVVTGIDASAAQGILTTSGAANNNVQLMRGTASTLRATVTATTSQMDVSGGAMSALAIYKAALRVQTDDCKFTLNGAIVGSDSSVTLPSAPTTVDILNRGGGGSPFFGYLRRAAIWPTAFSDANLQSVTA